VLFNAAGDQSNFLVWVKQAFGVSRGTLFIISNLLLRLSHRSATRNIYIYIYIKKERNFSNLSDISYSGYCSGKGMDSL
jgi:hypothetical protein